MYDGILEVREDGKVFRLRNGKRVESGYGKCGCNSEYLSVAFTYKGVRRIELVHRLVAKAFIPNPLNLPQVNHIDRNPRNNRVRNLEWCTPEQNMQWSYKFIMKARNKKLQTLRKAFNLAPHEMAEILSLDVMSYKKLENGVIAHSKTMTKDILKYFQLEGKEAERIFVNDTNIEERKNLVKDCINLIVLLKKYRTKTSLNINYEIYNKMDTDWKKLKTICHRNLNKRCYVSLFEESYINFCEICLRILKKYGYQDSDLYERPQNIQTIIKIASVLNATVEEMFPLSGEK